MPRSRRRRWLFAGVAIALVLLLIETAGFATWWLMRGETFSWSRASAARASARTESAESNELDAFAERAAVQRAARPGTVVHPYLGFVGNAEVDQVGGFAVSQYGFVDDSSPLTRPSDDCYQIALVGGSVALQLGLYAEDKLIAELRKSPKLRDRAIDVVRLGMGGYKQPQQLLALQLLFALGARYDCVINLDGFNEIALVGETLPHGVPPWFPRGWHRLLDGLPTPAQQRRLGRLVVLRDRRIELAAGGDRLWFSPTWQCLWLARDRSLARQIGALAAAAERAATNKSFAVTGPGVGGGSEAEARADMIELWRRSSRQLQALCEQRGALYFHFLQPNQYVDGSKPIGPAEAAVALDDQHPYAEAVRASYAALRTAGEQLRANGVAFTDLTDVFRQHPEPLYVDTCCHVGRRGSELLATRIAAEIRRHLDLSGFRVESLVVPPQLRIDSPLQRVAIPVMAVDAAGARVDVAGKAFGTRMTAVPAGAIEVHADGSVRARRRGASRIDVAFGGRSASIVVQADWPDVLTVDDGRRAPSGPELTPRLVLLESGDETSPSTVGCSQLPQGLRVLAASLEPLPAVIRPGEEAFGVSLAMLGADGDSVTAPVPAPAPPTPGRPLFLRVFVLDPASSAVVATSNSLVCTRD